MAPSYIAGLSLLGGEPFEPANQRALVKLLRRVRREYPQKTVWCYTGYLYDSDLCEGGRAHCEATDEMLSFIDVLVDGEFVEEKKDLKLQFRGSSNQRILDVKECLKTAGWFSTGQANIDRSFAQTENTSDGEIILNKILVRFKKLDERAIAPTYGSDCAAGADLYALADKEITIGAGETAFVHTGIAAEIPENLVGLVYARSGLACKKGLAPANKVGVIDSDYRGEIMVALYNQSNEPRTIADGERIAQLVIAPYLRAEFTECETLSDTARGRRRVRFYGKIWKKGLKFQ